MPSIESTTSRKAKAAEQVLAAYGFSAESMERMRHGLINRTWRVRERSGKSYALQRLSPILGPEIHDDIEAVTAHLAAKGVPTPRLMRSLGGASHIEREDGVWRVFSWLEGQFYNRLQHTGQAGQAGALLGRFHRALCDYRKPFSTTRRPIHEPARRFAELALALNAHRSHRLHREAEALERRILELASQLPKLPVTPLRVVHGDPKINNMLFTSSGAGLAMVDLDSLGRLSLPYELGDALRSWCNPAGENREQTEFSTELFRAARSGYLSVARFITGEEKSCLVDATLWITLELTSRFAADILNDRYFGWDPQRFPSRAEHNRVRARGQLCLAERILASRAELQA